MNPRPSPDPLEDLRAGLADRYRIEREVGSGGMAVVYLAQDLRHHRNVALKVLRAELGPAGGPERFEREIRLVAGLVHPNILPLLDSGVTAGRLWYTMPFVEGESLRARLEREKQLALAETIRLTGEIADGLGHAHAMGIIHRDIKPENVLLVAGHALIADFGIARALGGSGDRLTGTGLALGTPGYMSPEQSTGEHHLDARSDLYALASVSYEMLAGEPPFTGPTAQAVIARRLSQPAPSIRLLRPAVPEAVDDALRRALASVPADRFESTAEFSRALTLATNPTRGPAVRSRWPVLVAGGVLVVAAVLVSRRVRRPESAPPPPDPAGAGVRLAVLPFRMLGADSSAGYLAEGITLEVTSALSNLGGLRVIDRGSVARYTGSGASVRDIGAALRADGLINGDVEKSGNVIRVHVALIDPATEERRWSQTYDHTAENVFQVQSEVATKVAGVLRIQLAERESRSLRRPPTTNPAAYDAYLRALGRSRTRDPSQAESTSDSIIASLERAVRLDSTFAPAWARLAAELINTVFGFDADSARLGRADRAIGTALRLDSTLALAWKARQDLNWNAVRGWHFPEALADVRRAVALQPSVVEAHNALGSLYSHYGFMAEARGELEASLSLDPSDGCDNPTRCFGFSRPRVARVLWYQQKFDSALAIYRTIPTLGGREWEKAVVLNGLGRAAEGLAVLDAARTAGVPEPADREAVRGLLHAALAHSKEALDHLAAAMARPESASHFHHAQFTIACAYARLGRTADAVRWLTRAAENGMPNYPLFRNDPNLKALQGNPEYERLMADLERQFEANARLVHQSP